MNSFCYGISDIIDFFVNDKSIDSIIGKNETGTTLEEILLYNDNRLDSCHYFIQWVLPTSRRSAFNGSAPYISKEDIETLKIIPKFMENLERIKTKMFSYWGIEPADYNRIKILNGHDGLRLSRAIECLNSFGFDISYILPILTIAINHGLIKPSYIDDKVIWFVRYDESK